MIFITTSVIIRFLAEREGFEPPEPRSSTVFKTAAIDHSAISPGAKVMLFLRYPKKQGIFIINKYRYAIDTPKKKEVVHSGQPLLL